MLNQVVLVGRLVENPTVTTSENGKKYTFVNLAVPRSFKNQDGTYETDFIRCVLWNGIASNTAEYCHSGDVVGIKGRLQTRRYEDSEKKLKYITEVIAEKVSFLASSHNGKKTTDKSE
ncbi:MAG: single-stranded DNA-binding protein [Firmicutes bacterium]|nr:single-stranded DNA-binding protein [Bacillota bacterium]